MEFKRKKQKEQLIENETHKVSIKSRRNITHILIQKEEVEKSTEIP